MESRISFDCTNERCNPRLTEAKILNKQSVPAACNSCLGRRGLEGVTGLSAQALLTFP